MILWQIRIIVRVVSFVFQFLERIKMFSGWNAGDIHRLRYSPELMQKEKGEHPLSVHELRVAGNVVSGKRKRLDTGNPICKLKPENIRTSGLNLTI
jgi:hypothetical protein